MGTHVRLDEESRILEHRVEQVERLLQDTQIVQMSRNLSHHLHQRSPHRAVQLVLTCSPPQATRYGTN